MPTRAASGIRPRGEALCARAIRRGCDSSGRPKSSAEASDIAGIVRAALAALVAENRRARDENIGSGRNRFAGRIVIDAAVDLQHDFAFAGFDALANRRDFRKLTRKKGLSAESRIDRHDENEIKKIKNRIYGF